MVITKRPVLLLLLSFLWNCSLAFQKNDGYAPSSVLSQGRWFRMAVSENGIYRIDYSRLRQIGLPDPSNPRIFGNPAGQLSFYNNDPSPDDLREIAVYLEKGSDGIFNEGDYLLFYGQGTHRWKYNYQKGEFDFSRHHYSDSSYYFITSSPQPGKTTGNAPETTSQPDYYSSSYDALHIHEVETENLIKSGREWYQPVSSISPLQINPGFSGIIPGEKIRYSIRVLGRSSAPVMFRFYEGTTLHQSIMVPEVNMFSTTGMFARDLSSSGSITPSSASPVFEIRFYNNGEQSARGWTDYVKLFTRTSLVFTGKTTEFTDSESMAPGRITGFSFKSSAASLSLWDVTDPFDPLIIRYVKNGETVSFTSSTDSLRRFISFSPDKALSPVIRSKPVVNQNLHGSEPAGMIIVTHPLFIKYASELSDIHYEFNGLRSLIVTPEEIYNEFSGGVPDIAAIRNFIRMKYLKQEGSSIPLKYLLLFGDGSYENKTLPPKNPNFVPTYQSQNSTIIVSSFTSDDFYGLLEDGEGEAEGTEDIGIGRFPVSDTLQASIMVSKVKRYLGRESRGDWRNIIAIAADDEDGNTHMIDAEGLAGLLNTKYPDFNVDKIYMDAFRQVTSVNGQSYPDVTKAINDRINSGCLIFDYLGHGSEIGLAHERVVKTEDINSWRNGSRLPVFITATCEFSRFDDIEISPVNREMTGKNSAGEMVLLNPDGGGIALLTTTRVVYSAPNYTLNRNILNFAFTRDSDGNSLGLGEIIRLAKLNSGSGLNKRNFLLLGDPALKLAWPWHGKVVTDSVNGISISQPADSLKALSVITVSGHVENPEGELKSDFNGIVYPVVLDKSRKVRSLSNDGGPAMEFDIRNNVLFRGKTKATGGRFRFTFIVPKDIDYSFGPGKISYYATENDSDMAGSFSSFIVGGFANTVSTDISGPEIKLYLNDTLFRNGGISDENPVLLAVISDDGGVNTTGAGIGHDLTAWLDNDRNMSFVLNNYFETELDNYRKGIVRYPLQNLQAGDHSITMKAWDNFNNSSEATLRFLVKTENGFIINNLINYPNPFTGNTAFTAEHNRPDELLDIRIKIYDMSGTLIRIIDEKIQSYGYRLPPVTWDGNTAGGKRAGRGIYSYSVTVTTSGRETARSSGRMIIL